MSFLPDDSLRTAVALNELAVDQHELGHHWEALQTLRGATQHIATATSKLPLPRGPLSKWAQPTSFVETMPVVVIALDPLSIARALSDVKLLASRSILFSIKGLDPKSDLRLLSSAILHNYAQSYASLAAQSSSRSHVALDFHALKILRVADLLVTSLIRQDPEDRLALAIKGVLAAGIVRIRSRSGHHADTPYLVKLQCIMNALLSNIESFGNLAAAA